MRIKTVEMKNFRPYRSEKVEFSTKEDDNLNLVVGPNDYGKTSLMNAVEWALYGHENQSMKRNYEDCLHDGVKDRENPEMYVEIKFDHDGSDFVLRRELDKVIHNREKAEDSLIITIDGENVLEGSEAVKKVDQILPRSIKRFYLFDAEEIEETAEKTSEMQDKIERVLGLHPVEKAEEHIDRLIKNELDKKYREKTEENSKKEEREEELEKLKQEKKDLKERIEKKENRKEKKEKDLKDIEEDLGNLDETEPLIDEKKELETDIQKLENELIQVQEKRRNAWEDLFKNLISPVSSEIVDLLREKQEEIKKKEIDQQIYRLQEKAERDDECPVCYNKDIEGLVKESSQEEENLQEIKNELNRKIRTLESLNHVDVNPLEIEKRRQDILRKLENKKKDKKDKEDKIEDKIGNITDERAELWREEKKGLKNDIEALEEDLEGNGDKKGLRDKYEEKKKEITDLRDEISDLSEDEEVKKIKRKRDLAHTVRDKLSVIQERVVEEKREGIEKQSNEIFKQLTNTPEAERRFTLIKDSGYRYTLVREDGSQPNISPGKEQIMSLSFILGLNHYADRDAPMIMDTPVMRLGEKHREKVGGYLGDLNEQIILLLTDAEYNDIIPYLENIGREFKIERDAQEDKSWIEVKE